MKKTAVVCPFCTVDPGRVYLENVAGIALHDAFPVTEGHTLVVPKRHVASLFDLEPAEQAALWRLVREVRGRLATGFPARKDGTWLRRWRPLLAD